LYSRSGLEKVTEKEKGRKRMEFRLAEAKDLQGLIEVYTEIVKKMYQEGNGVWNDVYPCSYFPSDIEKQRLYILTDGQIPVSAFVLCDDYDGQEQISWKDPDAKALYMGRLGVNPDYRGQNIGSKMIRHAMEVSQNQGIEYLRLLVVESNRSAVHLYEKNGFEKAKGVYQDELDGEILSLYGYEHSTGNRKEAGTE
jgi:ribosomal protein S18 acetylase RimI-like enzyme